MSACPCGGALLDWRGESERADPSSRPRTIVARDAPSDLCRERVDDGGVGAYSSVGEHTFVNLPSEVHAWLDRLRAADILLPPLDPPACCARCQRPLELEKQRFGTCYDCGFKHGAGLSRVTAATYAALGTAPWELLLDAKFVRLAPDAVAQRVTVVAAGIWAAIERTAPEFFGDPQRITVPIPSSSDLIGRCVAEAPRRGWPALTIEDRLQTEPRPRQTELAAEHRREAAQGKYRFEGRLEGARVLLLDDVYTSGYTMHDAARAVREAGATDVIGVVYARRVFPDVMALYRETRDV